MRLLLWLFRVLVKKEIWWINCPLICLGGGTTIEQPSPPPQPSTAEAIQAWTEAMPTVFAEQQRQAPLQAQQQVELAQEYAEPMGQAMRAAQAGVAPETTALQEQLAGQAAEGMEEGLSPEEMEMYRDIYASQLGTNVGSPIGADYMGRNLLQAQQQRQDYYRNLGLSTAQRQPIAQPAMPQTGQYSQGFTPQGVMGYKASTYAPYAGAYSSMYGTNAQMAQQQGGNMGGLGAGAGALAGGLLALPTGGMSIPMGAMIGSSLGGGAGSMVGY